MHVCSLLAETGAVTAEARAGSTFTFSPCHQVVSVAFLLPHPNIVCSEEKKKKEQTSCALCRLQTNKERTSAGGCHSLREALGKKVGALATTSTGWWQN